MLETKYSSMTLFAIASILAVCIFFTSTSERANAETSSAATGNELRHQIPRDNDANYSLPTYIPTHSQSMPRQKIEFKPGQDNDALYYTPVAIPKNLPKKAAPKKAPVQFNAPAPASVAAPAPVQQQYVAPQPAAPLQPQPRQPVAPVYVPHYQQQPTPIYQPAPVQQPEPEPEEYYPYYYY